MDYLLTWLSGLSAKYGAIVAGLAIGTAAKYGLTLSEGRKLTTRGVIADLLLLGMLGLLAIAIADWLALTGNARVLAGALAAVSSDRLVRLVRERFLKKVADDMDLPADSMVELGPNSRPTVAKVSTASVRPLRHPLRDAYPPINKPDVEMDRLLKRLGDTEV